MTFKDLIKSTKLICLLFIGYNCNDEELKFQIFWSIHSLAATVMFNM